MHEVIENGFLKCYNNLSHCNWTGRSPVWVPSAAPPMPEEAASIWGVIAAVPEDTATMTEEVIAPYEWFLDRKRKMVQISRLSRGTYTFYLQSVMMS